MLDKIWKSDRLLFQPFEISEAEVAKDIFDSNNKLVSNDPTFCVWPLSEFETLIQRDLEKQVGNDECSFYLRKIINHNDETVGYFQLELNAPSAGICWLPMLVFKPDYQSSGYGKEVVNSILMELRKQNQFSHIKLNVYAENVNAFRFWFNNGFSDIEDFMKENQFGKDYNCLILSRKICT